MVSYLGRLAAVVAFAAPLALGAPTAAPAHIKIRAPAINAEVVADSYIVVYNKDVTAEVASSHIETVNSMIASRKRDIPSEVVDTYDIDT